MIDDDLEKRIPFIVLLAFFCIVLLAFNIRELTINLRNQNQEPMIVIDHKTGVFSEEDLLLIITLCHSNSKHSVQQICDFIDDTPVTKVVIDQEQNTVTITDMDMHLHILK